MKKKSIDKNRYVKAYTDKIRKAEAYGGTKDMSSFDIVEEYLGGFTSEETVGFYITKYDNHALDKWNENFNNWNWNKYDKTDSHYTKVWEILKHIYENKKVSYTDTESIAINCIDKLIDLKILPSDQHHFEVQDFIHDQINKVLGIDYEDNFEIEIINNKAN